MLMAKLVMETKNGHIVEAECTAVAADLWEAITEAAGHSSVEAAMIVAELMVLASLTVAGDRCPLHVMLGTAATMAIHPSIVNDPRTCNREADDDETVN